MIPAKSETQRRAAAAELARRRRVLEDIDMTPATPPEFQFIFTQSESPTAGWKFEYNGDWFACAFNVSKLVGYEQFDKSFEEICTMLLEDMSLVYRGHMGIAGEEK